MHRTKPWPCICRGGIETPPLDGDRPVSVAIAGGGYTGLSAALHLALLGVDVAVLEAHEPGWGASGRNGGQVIPGLKAGTITMRGDSIVGTDGVYVKYGATILIADSATVNQQTHDVVADGNVRIQTGEQIWVGEHITYNMNTHIMQSQQFRAQRPYQGWLRRVHPQPCG